MTSAYKILGQVRLGSSLQSANLVSTVPAGKSYVVSSITVSSEYPTSPTANSDFIFGFNVNAIPSGSALPASQTAILYKVPIELGTSVSFSLGITLGEGDRLSSAISYYGTEYAYSGRYTVTAFGEEITL